MKIFRKNFLQVICIHRIRKFIGFFWNFIKLNRTIYFFASKTIENFPHCTAWIKLSSILNLSLAKSFPLFHIYTTEREREMRTRLHANVACIQLCFGKISCQQRKAKFFTWNARRAFVINTEQQKTLVFQTLFYINHEGKFFLLFWGGNFAGILRFQA